MTLKVLVVTVALSALSWSTAAAFGAQSAPAHDVRVERLEHWLATLLRHNPGLPDDATVRVGTWSTLELQTLYVDASALTWLLRNPKLTSQTVAFFFTMPTQPGRAAQLVRHTPDELVRFKQIACAVGGFLESPPCDWVRDSIARDTVLASLSRNAAAVRHADENFILRRAALLHTDIAMLGLAAPLTIDLSPGSQPVRMSISDGQQTALTQPDLHWELARQLLDQITAPGSTRPAPGRDAMVRLWYIATNAWMQRDGHHENNHLEHGREIFPDDADLAMLMGAHHEAYAAPAVQTAVRSAFLPTGVRLEVQSERTELREAEKYLRRAVELRPDYAEAQIRLGRVLALMGRDADAADHLRRALQMTDEPLLLYYSSMFVAAVEEKLGHDEIAKAAYTQAAALYPTAQSPLVSLSELARRAGHRDEALKYMEEVYRLESADSRSDPWWTYTYAQGRNADALFERLYQPFRLGAGQ